MQIHRHWLILAGLFGLTATMLGAYGAHGLAAIGITPERLAAFNTAVQYQFFHALALLVLSWCGVRSKVIHLAGTAFVLGIIGFSGSIYAMELLGSKGLGLITLAGGLCFMLGWAALIWAGCRLGGKMNNLLLYCRSGFEKEAAAEITERAGNMQCYGFARVKDDNGYVIFELYDEEQADLLARKLPFRELIFIRQMLVVTHELKALDVADRIPPIIEAVREYTICGDLRVETADTNEAKELSVFCRKFTVPLRQALRSNEILTKKETPNRPVFHAFFMANDHVLLGYSYSFNNSGFHMGIPRLHFPADAPNRSSLKLEEAFCVFVPWEEWDVRLCSGMKAVDLGACPGGWTYQLVRRGMMVTAVDNSMMAQSLMDTGQVKHIRDDGFVWRPSKKNTYWLVCDMVDKPARVVHMIADWFREGDCQEAMFNLKLPMKKRYAESVHNIEVLCEMLKEIDNAFVIQAKQLYHDREEITVHVYNKYWVSKLELKA